jgi:hypothetical protein
MFEQGHATCLSPYPCSATDTAVRFGKLLMDSADAAQAIAAVGTHGETDDVVRVDLQ